MKVDIEECIKNWASHESKMMINQGIKQGTAKNGIRVAIKKLQELALTTVDKEYEGIK